MQAKYVNFIRNGNPNRGEDVEWPQYKAGTIWHSSKVMRFGKLFGPQYAVVNERQSETKCNIWQRAPFRDSSVDLLQKQSPSNQWEL